jgi:CHASE1-domain containing sensor protein
MPTASASANLKGAMPEAAGTSALSNFVATHGLHAIAGLTATGNTTRRDDMARKQQELADEIDKMQQEYEQRAEANGSGFMQAVGALFGEDSGTQDPEPFHRLFATRDASSHRIDD